MSYTVDRRCPKRIFLFQQKAYSFHALPPDIPPRRLSIMILDLISRLPLYDTLIPGAAEIAAAFTAEAPDAAPCEVREKSYSTKADDKRRFEVHEHTIDLMMARHGAEVIHICPKEDFIPAEALKDALVGQIDLLY